MRHTKLKEQRPLQYSAMTLTVGLIHSETAGYFDHKKG